MGNLFYRGASITELKAMGFREMRYWNEWHELMTQAEKDSVKSSGR